MRFRKSLIEVFLLCIILWTAAVVRINKRIVQPVEQAYGVGECFMYYGLEITPLSIDVYAPEEFSKRFKFDFSDSDIAELILVVVKTHVKNFSGCDISLKDNMHTWVLETENFRNGQQMDYMVLNSGNPYEKDAELDYYLVFAFYEGKNYKGGIERLKEAEKKVYLCFYPEARYMYFN